MFETKEVYDARVRRAIELSRFAREQKVERDREAARQADRHVTPQSLLAILNESSVNQRD